MKITFNLNGIIRGIRGFFGLFKAGKNHHEHQHEHAHMSMGGQYVPEVQEGKTEAQFVDFVKAVFGGEYQIAENYDVRNIDPSMVEARPYTLAFFRDGQLALTILYTRHNGEKNRYFLNAKRTSEMMGVRCLNFFEHFPNEDEYIVSRIRENL